MLLNCSTQFVHPTFQPIFQHNLFTHIPPPIFFSIKLSLFGNILLCPLSFQCHPGQLCSLCGGYVISVTVERYFWQIIHFQQTRCSRGCSTNISMIHSFIHSFIHWAELVIESPCPSVCAIAKHPLPEVV